MWSTLHSAHKQCGINLLSVSNIGGAEATSCPY